MDGVAWTKKIEIKTEGAAKDDEVHQFVGLTYDWKRTVTSKAVPDNDGFVIASSQTYSKFNYYKIILLSV
jgi:hypothetical protein